MERKKKKNNFYIILRIILAMVCFFSGAIAIKQISGYIIEDNYYDSVEKESVEIKKEYNKAQKKKTTNIKVNFDKLEKTNKDIVAWVYVKGTKINYPVVQGKDNNYYLGKLFNKKDGKAGCIFLDAKNKPDFSENHMILYGHHMKDKSMFGSLEQLKKQDFFNKHHSFYVITREKTYKVDIFSVYVSQENGTAWDIDLDKKEERDAWIKSEQMHSLPLKKLSQRNGRVITLSTCDYTFDNARLVVHGILRED